MHVAVTGACGRVGRVVVAELLDRGHRVTGLDLRAPAEPVAGLTHLTGDLAALPPGDPRLADVEAVAHLGALMSWDETDAERLLAANTTATATLVRALTGARVRRFVLASSGEVYPENSPQYQPLDEQHPRLPGTWYGLSKLLAEEVVAFAGRTQGWSTVVLRFAHTQDPAELLDPDSSFSGPRFFASRRLPRARAAGYDAAAQALEPFAGDDGTLLLAHREDGEPVRMPILATSDLAHGVVLALEATTTGHEVVGLGPDESLDLADLARDLAAAAGLRTVDVTFPVAPSYRTSNVRATELLGFVPRVTRDDLVREAAAAHRSRRSDRRQSI
jgi:UDP-glucose 4-epimerase